MKPSKPSFALTAVVLQGAFLLTTVSSGARAQNNSPASPHLAIDGTVNPTGVPDSIAAVHFLHEIQFFENRDTATGSNTMRQFMLQHMGISASDTAAFLLFVNAYITKLQALDDQANAARKQGNSGNTLATLENAKQTVLLDFLKGIDSSTLAPQLAAIVKDFLQHMKSRIKVYTSN